MENLKYTTLEDVKEFLKTLNYSWNGNVRVCGKTEPAHIEHLRYNACLIVKNLKTNRYKHLVISVTDDYFHIVKDNPEMKYDIINHSIAWQAFMINRKSKDYAKFLYAKTVTEKNKLEKDYNNQINLVMKQAENLRYKKSFEMSKLNTTLFNVETKLTSAEIQQLTNQVQESL